MLFFSSLSSTSRISSFSSNRKTSLRFPDGSKLLHFQNVKSLKRERVFFIHFFPLQFRNISVMCIAPRLRDISISVEQNKKRRKKNRMQAVAEERKWIDPGSTLQSFPSTSIPTPAPRDLTMCSRILRVRFRHGLSPRQL